MLGFISIFVGTAAALGTLAATELPKQLFIKIYMQKIFWIIIFLLLGIGFVPYKFPKYPHKREPHELLVENETATCSGDFKITNGSLQIPSNLISHFPNGSKYLKLSGGKSPFDPIDRKQTNWFLISENSFIISGKVISIDSVDKQGCGHNYPVFKIYEWSPTKYFPNYRSFSLPIFLLYLTGIIITTLSSLILFIVRRTRKPISE